MIQTKKQNTTNTIMASRTLRSNAKFKVIPTRSYSAALRNSKQKEPTFLSLANSKKQTLSGKERNSRSSNNAPKGFTPPPKGKSGAKQQPAPPLVKEQNESGEMKPTSETSSNDDKNNDKVCEGISTTQCNIPIDKTEIDNAKKSGATTETSNPRKRGRPGKQASEKASENVVDASETVVVAKRKRGRPKKTEKMVREISEDVLPPNDSKRVKKGRIEWEENELATIERSEASPPPASSPRRKPRMASLNALAKVNAVLENYRFERTKEIVENIVQMEDSRGAKDEQKKKIKEKVAETKVKVEVQEEEEGEEMDPLSDDEELITPRDCSQLNDEATVEEDVEEVFLSPSPPPVPPPEMLDQAIQTEECTESRALQTESFVFPSGGDAHAQTLCTCRHHHMSSDRRKFPSKYDLAYQQSGDVPIHVRSTVLAHTPSHTLALPLIKAHHLPLDGTVHVYSGMTENISNLLDRCLKRSFSQKNVYPVCAKLVQISTQKEAREKKKRLAEMAQQRLEQKKNAQRLVIPSLHCEPISISIPSSKYPKDSVSKKTNNRKQSSRQAVNVLPESPEEKVYLYNYFLFFSFCCFLFLVDLNLLRARNCSLITF